MIRVEHVEVFNLEGTIRGLRNPMNSWDKSDSGYDCARNEKELCVPPCTVDNYCDRKMSRFVVGENDLALMKKLYKAGTEHRKYLRQIMVSMDITAPLYWIAEFDTYKVGITRNSCSFMHKGVSNPFKIVDFSTHDSHDILIWTNIIAKLNSMRDKYLATKDEQIFQQIRCMLPSGYNQQFTVTMNYENVVNIINQRSHHRLEEWREFCEILLQELPYLKDIMEERGYKE